ncbi:hypothetical protein EHI8A_049800 [Entamoeba histolytica HM-1:IMSS-B]|uniref:t-SNARE coiled-coil homology domain-containing protein n=9 Tax=Entamoeba TaxID=5758 RepID=A0A8U0WPG9_ENTH1|nr:hypothetical protein ENU1_197810 [Entamoeba nuttalli P19]XP_651416.1 hypothetical protein EHI_054110 [Entamoeba histolytica HM-1:IMSS]EMD48857.1 ehsyntaxin C, putative [Entamoeba histolytica KU27]EMH73537.1 hypothetical protein EHI8A_049800 [Entamoeba histolytica HM-1:IMSS-B]EMS16331.1 EhSyntaxin C, putative [Entamoeba histolytica HM-3:IMSS]ENY60717.1 EhSyntaxin C, putative [Entamoeba histolytica HM-1:IMSS-A]BAE94807.1 EhSyntaxin C [Entamoeba histolytica]|eukprot:XP_008860239.1 hypothetical protein ENU1_197810 [Entamoeba nuttalli P19]
MQSNNPYDENDLLLVQVDNDKTQRIKDVNTKMKEINTGISMMNSITKTQQTVIDQLEYNYQNAEEYTAKSAMEIDKAGKYQFSGDKKRLIILLILVIVVTFLIFIIWYKLH